VRGRLGVYDILYGYGVEEAALLAGRLALKFCDGLLPVELSGVEGLDRICSDDIAPGVEKIRSAEAAVEALTLLMRRHALGPSTQALVDAARRRGVPLERMNGQSLIRLGWGRVNACCAPACQTGRD